MNNFDFSPVLKYGIYNVAGRLLLTAAPFVLMFVGAGLYEFALSLVRGIVIGVLDSIIMLEGARRALPYANNPYKGLLIMGRFRVYRIVSACSLFALMLRMNYPAFGASLGFLLIHILFLFNLLFIAYRLNRITREERSEKDGK